MLPRLVIPSYNRPELLKAKTLSFLNSVKYPTDRIIIFVASELEKTKYATLISDIYICVGVLGLINQRNFISDYLAEDEIYISFDDDITGIKCPYKTFNEIIELGIEAITKRETGLFGVRPNDNGLCLKDKVTTHLSHIVGAFFIARNHKNIRITINLIEDYERSILYFLKYSKVYRYNGAGVATRYLGTSVGTEDIIPKQRAAVIEICNRFPGLCKEIIKKNGWPDISLNWRCKISKIE